MTLYANIACDVPRTREGLAVGWQARALWYEALLFMRENLTDGYLATNQLALVAPDMPMTARRRAVDAWVTVGWVDVVEGGWQVPLDAWREYNPTRAEVESFKETKREAGIRGNHERWHLPPEGKPSHRCPLCQSQTSRTSDRKHVAPANRIGSLEPEPEPERKPERKPEPEPIRTSRLYPRALSSVVPDAEPRRIGT